MFLDLVPILNAFIILASMLWLGLTISKIIRREREYRKVREERVDEMIDEINTAASRVFDSAQRIYDHQKIFDDKMDALTAFVDKHSTNVAFQQERFDAFAKADVLSARREELLRCKELKAALERLMGVALTSRQPPSPNDVVAIENLTKRIEELELILNKER